MANYSETVEYCGYSIFIDKGTYYKGFITSPDGYVVDTGGQALTREHCIKRCYQMIEWRESRIRDTIRVAVDDIEREWAR